MLVRLPETLTITEQFNLDRFNEIELAAGERPVRSPMQTSHDVAGFADHLKEIGARTITYDDGLNPERADRLPRRLRSLRHRDRAAHGRHGDRT